jgi:hypothetical protein
MSLTVVRGVVAAICTEEQIRDSRLGVWWFGTSFGREITRQCGSDVRTDVAMCQGEKRDFGWRCVPPSPYVFCKGNNILD